MEDFSAFLMHRDCAEAVRLCSNLNAIWLFPGTQVHLGMEGWRHFFPLSDPSHFTFKLFPLISLLSFKSEVS